MPCDIVIWINNDFYPTLGSPFWTDTVECLNQSSSQCQQLVFFFGPGWHNEKPDHARPVLFYFLLLVFSFSDFKWHYCFVLFRFFFFSFCWSFGLSFAFWYCDCRFGRTYVWFFFFLFSFYYYWPAQATYENIVIIVEWATNLQFTSIK